MYSKFLEIEDESLIKLEKARGANIRQGNFWIPG